MKFTLKYGTDNKIQFENISIKLATAITTHTQKATMTSTIKATVAMTAKIKITVDKTEKIINK